MYIHSEMQRFSRFLYVCIPFPNVFHMCGFFPYVVLGLYMYILVCVFRVCISMCMCIYLCIDVNVDMFIDRMNTELQGGYD